MEFPKQTFFDIKPNEQIIVRDGLNDAKVSVDMDASGVTTIRIETQLDAATFKVSRHREGAESSISYLVPKNWLPTPMPATEPGEG